MMNKRRRVIAATELRVHLGEALRSLEREELVIEKGGVPVALLIKYEPERSSGIEAEYERALSKRAEPEGWKKMESVLAAGWAGIDADELVANIYRWREEGRSLREYRLDEQEGESDGGEVSPGQRRMRARDPQTQRVADGDGEPYQA